MDWDVFISHATEDKDSFARPLAKALQAKGLKVWFDEFSLSIGDRLRRSIDNGLANSRYGIVILSENFFKKEWPQQELDGLASREVSGTKVILPIWHNINEHQIRKYSPTLADRVAVTSSRGLDNVVIELLYAMEKSASGRIISEATAAPLSRRLKLGWLMRWEVISFIVAALTCIAAWVAIPQVQNLLMEANEFGVIPSPTLVLIPTGTPVTFIQPTKPPTLQPTATYTPDLVRTPTDTPISPTSTPTSTSTPTRMLTFTPTPTVTASPSSTPTTTRTPTPTPTATLVPISTLEQIDVPVSVGRLHFGDDFFSQISNWDNYSNQIGAVGYEDGKYFIEKKTGGVFWGLWKGESQFKDGVLQVRILNSSERGDIYQQGIGFGWFNWQGNSYVFSADFDGQCHFIEAADNSQQRVHTPQYSGEIPNFDKSRESHVLTVMIQGNEARGYVDGIFCGQYIMPNYKAGYVGVIATSHNEGGKGKSFFDNYRIYELP